MMFYLTYFDYKLKHKSIILKLVEKRNCVRGAIITSCHTLPKRLGHMFWINKGSYLKRDNRLNMCKTPVKYVFIITAY